MDGAIDLDLLGTTPYRHQLEALEQSWDRESYALFLEMGLGKTKVTIDTGVMLFDRGEIDAALVIAPSGVYRNWTDVEIPRHLPEAPYLVVHWTPTPTKREARAIEEALKPGHGFVWFVMNVEALSTAKGQAAAKRFLEAHRCLFVVDESTAIKNPRAARTKAILALRHKAPYRRILTGSPVTKSPLDLFTPCLFLDPSHLGHRSYYSFRNRYAELAVRRFGEKRFQEIVGYRNLDELQAKLARFSTRKTKAECLDLPEKIYQRRTVVMDAETAHEYRRMRDEAVATLDGEEVTATIVLAQITRLHQIVCGSRNRIAALLETLEETSGKAIIWCTYTRDVHRVVSALDEGPMGSGVVSYHGETPAGDRPWIVEAFQRETGPRFFVGQPATGGYGLTLTAASTVIYYSSSYDLEKRIQSEDRAHRIGQRSAVTYVDLVTPGTVDEKILDALRGKKNLATEVLGDHWREWI